MKFLRVTAITVLFALIISVCAFAKEDSVFSDVKSTKWYYDEVMEAYNQGIMVGVSEDKFSPDTQVTREMFITALSRISMTSVEQYHEHKSTFKDVVHNNWYADAIEWATKNGIAYGLSEDKFGVGTKITREQIATFIYRFIKVYLYKTEQVKKPADKFTDKCSDYANQAIEFMRTSGVVSGREKGKFAPKENATRAEVAAILVRLQKLIKEPEFAIDLNYEEIEKMGVFCTIFEKNIVVEKDSQIKDFVDFLNDTPIAFAEYVGQTIGWDHSIVVFDKDGNETFTLYFTTSYFVINDCLYHVDNEHFKPIVDKVK